MSDFNLDQLAAMEEEFLKLQKIELAIDSPQSKTSKLIHKYAVSASTYDNAEKLDKMLGEIESIIEEIAKSGQVRGRVMSLKTMERFLEKEERSMLKQRTLDMIDRSNFKRSQKRLELYVDEALRDFNVMKTDIDLFRKRARLAGFSEKQINKQLVEAAYNNASPVSAFGKKLKSVEKAVLRRESAASEIDEYRKVARADEDWQWITVSASPCPDCRIRAGAIMSYTQWQKIGLPGDGRTICMSHCMCKLMPTTVADDLFPDVKQFRWNKDTGVLTTYNEMKTLGADKNQPEK